MGRTAPPTPKWLPKKYEHHWKFPYGRKARRSKGFKNELLKHGYLSPNFKKREAACNDGTRVPAGQLTKNAQKHAFNLERLRHKIGDKPISPISWYRHPAYNLAIGGASQSRHMSADATDFSRQLIDSVGRTRFFAAANKVFKNGGVGTYPAGSGHVDSRGWFARWTSF